jgi:deoxyribodipyrimidine photo-lyase
MSDRLVALEGRAVHTVADVATGTVDVVLFTGDLRVHDNPVLRAACDGAGQVVPLFVLDEGVPKAGFAAPNRMAFLAGCLTALDAELRRRGGRLVLRAGDVVAEVRRVAAEAGAGRVHLAAGHSRYAVRREEQLRAGLAADGRELRVHDAVGTVLPPGEVVPTGGARSHFSVFTAYYRRWEERAPRSVLAAPKVVRVPGSVRSDRLPQSPAVSPGLPEGGEGAGRERFRRWLAAGGIAGYVESHDDLAGDATSRLSPYLHFGCLSPVELVHRVRQSGGAGADAFVRQLAWRDFHHQVLAARPDAAVRELRTKGDVWFGDGPEAEAWRQGLTGYPVVDAAMRQLRQEGWVHNRARLLAASFLTKTLYVDWRIGAAHYLEFLVDGDVASNQLNWQWVAGTGTDTRPNRVLNPVTQARRFDPKGDYVRRWVPELAEAGLRGAEVHQPWLLSKGRRAGLNYPKRLVDLVEAQGRFRAARGLSD